MTPRTKPAAPFIFVTGGCRSGKSAYAERVVKGYSSSCLYIATAQAHDEEMRERIRLHQQARGGGWRLFESPVDEATTLAQRLSGLVLPGEAVLFDCLSLWTASCMKEDNIDPNFTHHCKQLMDALQKLGCPVVLVSSEVGMGVVPPTKAGRTFRDMAGTASQMAAQYASSVIFMVSGLPLLVKGELPPF